MRMHVCRVTLTEDLSAFRPDIYAHGAVGADTDAASQRPFTGNAVTPPRPAELPAGNGTADVRDIPAAPQTRTCYARADNGNPRWTCESRCRAIVTYSSDCSIPIQS